MGDEPNLCDDLRNVQKGDEVTLTTTKENEYQATCDSITVDHNPEPGEEIVKKTTRFWFTFNEREAHVSVIDGLSRFDQQDSYPHHSPLYDVTKQRSLGHIIKVKIHGQM
jgi:hypothetical protein